MRKRDPILTVGTVAFDDITTPFGTRTAILGGSATHFSMAARFRAATRIIAPIGTDFPQKYLDFLSRRGIDTSGVLRMEGESFYWKGRYDEECADAVTLHTRLGVLAGFTPVLTRAQRAAPYVFLANIDPTVQLRLLRDLDRPRIVGSDTMNFWIARSRSLIVKTLRKVDVLFINESEVKQLAQERMFLTALRAVKRMGMKVLIVKRGEHGVVLATDTMLAAAPAYPLERVVDPTGAGDAFAGAFMSCLARPGRVSARSLTAAVLYACVVASFIVEDFGCARLDRIVRQDIDRRLRLLKNMLISH